MARGKSSRKSFPSERRREQKLRIEALGSEHAFPFHVISPLDFVKMVKLMRELQKQYFEEGTVKYVMKQLAIEAKIDELLESITFDITKL